MATGFATMQGAMQRFIFHQGADTGDATLEWFMKIRSNPQNDSGHRSIFWTNGDNTANSNRINLFLNSFFTGPPCFDCIGADYNDGAHGNQQIISYGGTPLPIDPTTRRSDWMHIAVTRTETSPNVFQYNTFVNGTLVPDKAQTVDAAANPWPTSSNWLINGRQGGLAAIDGLIDEIRFSSRALAPSEFLRIIPEPSSVALTILALAAFSFIGATRRRRSAKHGALQL